MMSTTLDFEKLVQQKASYQQEIWEEHPVLHHYTSLDSCISILKSQELWASFYRDMNDPTEFQQIRKPLIRYMEEIIIPPIYRKMRRDPEDRRRIKRLGTPEKLINETAQHVIDVLYSACLEPGEKTSKRSGFLEPYIISFCSHKDAYTKSNGLLSQWRGYANNDGVCLVLDTRKLFVLMNKENQKYLYSYGALSSVVYEDDYEAFASEFAEFFLEIGKQIEFLFNDTKEFSNKIYSAFTNLASRCKHKAFKEEKEIRLVMSPWSQETRKTADLDDNRFGKMEIKAVREREAKERLVRYISLFKGFNDLPIKKVIIGPNQNQRKSKHLIESSVVWPVEVSMSETPLSI